MLRGLAAAAAATAVLGAVVMRRWDAQAGKQVADLTRARASDEWRFEERVAELETDLEESRELRVKLEQRLRAKRGELAGLRNEHAALLRRYATAETERASALEGRRLLEIESGAPATARALPSGAEKADDQVDEKLAEKVAEKIAEKVEEKLGEKPGEMAEGKPGEKPGEMAEGKADEKADEELDEKAESTEAAAEAAEAVPGTEAAADAPGATVAPTAPTVFSREGSKLFLRAAEALSRLDRATAPKDEDSAEAELTKTPAARTASADAPGETEAAQEDEARGQFVAVDGHTRAAATPTEAADTEEAPAPVAEEAAAPAAPAATQRPSGHYTVPTAVAVVPTTPVRRAAVEGGFDFFGTKASSASAALEAVQNEDLADVVGQEALALHKADAEAEFKQADEESRRIGQVIDLTAHDETEQIDVQRLRSAVS